MTKEQAIYFMLHNPMCKMTHTLFAPDEYVYSKGDGIIYEENGYVFEDFGSDISSVNGMRMRTGDNWMEGWRVITGSCSKDSTNDVSCETLLDYVETLRKLINGEWVDCDKVCDAMNIDFKDGMRLFSFGRQAFWNPAPLNGQKVITKFRIAEKTVQPAKPFISEEESAELTSQGCW